MALGFRRYFTPTELTVGTGLVGGKFSMIRCQVHARMMPACLFEARESNARADKLGFLNTQDYQSRREIEENKVLENLFFSSLSDQRIE